MARARVIPKFLRSKLKGLSADRRKFLKSLGREGRKKYLSDIAAETGFQRETNVAKRAFRRLFGTDDTPIGFNDYRGLLRKRVFRNAYRVARQKTVGSGGRIFAARVSQKVKESSFIGRVGGQSFQDIVRRWPDRVDERLQALLDDVTQQAFENVVNRTPVLTGEAALGWFVTNVNKYRRFIGNNQPHIRRLEHGWSRQPQRGNMVRSTLKRIPQMVTKAAARLAI